MYRKFIGLADAGEDLIPLCKICGFTPQQALQVEIHRLNSFPDKWNPESTMKIAAGHVAKVYGLPKTKTDRG